MHTSTTLNRLARETSPYLLQHASNPVDWYPWGEEAIARAREENKPILLSIGYSACHWCHVMAHESFEDPAIAAVMNELFINIKVDREERPDLDKVYQLAHQLLTQRGGGWPLTMFLSPTDQQPFFGGTYFPNQPRHGLPAFADLLRRVAEFYRTHQDEIRSQSIALREAFEHLAPRAIEGVTPLTLEPLQAAREALASQFDGRHGGFGTAPKFPQAASLEFLLRYWRSSAASEDPDLHALYMSTLTLTRMAEGGLQDHVGGGFARYSVDAFWMIPHFEKMLYDNAQLLRIYALAAVATGEQLFAQVAARTARWMLRDLRAPLGGFYSALDADSEGEEGKFYLWTPAEVREALGAERFAVVARRFGLDQPPNFEGCWHFHVRRTSADIGQELGLSPEHVDSHLHAAREILLQRREQRIPPPRDEKILTSWNALAASALASAGRALRDQGMIAAASTTIGFLRQHAMVGGMLHAVFKDGARFPAYLDDHAFLLEATIESLQSRWSTADLELAIQLAKTLLERFEDPEQGGFFFTAHDHQRLVHRSKQFSDEALPAGNAIAARSLQRLGLLLGQTKYLDAAARTLRAGWQLLARYPHAHVSMLLALWEHLEPPQIVIIRGTRTEEAAAWHDALCATYAPQRLVFNIPADAPLPAELASKQAFDATVAYVCRGTTCSEPIRSLQAVLALCVQ